ncbi:MAG: hypothetical protein LAT68_03215 [Cyclobacteriaceae bacterium]|nr:hypothetical protein [Cyclobacteriaceae bacterium]MCH8515317.1 hypothetical protein [Cyclobacteriaceae bacterium]
MKAHDQFKRELNSYKKKKYLNEFIKGVLISLASIAIIILVGSSLEHFYRFGTGLRSFLFFSGVFLSIGIFSRFIFYPLYLILSSNKQIDDEQAAKEIGKHFPEIEDKLLNLLQLSKLDQANDLIAASITQKADRLKFFQFTEAISFKTNIPYAKILAPLILLIAFILLFIPQLILESTNRIIQYDQSFEAEAPFKFILENNDLQAFANEDYTVKVRLEGSAIPSDLFLINRGRKNRLKQVDNSTYEFTFSKIRNNQRFAFEGAGYQSPTYEIKVANRPVLREFVVSLHFPEYLGLENKRQVNGGNLIIPQGTTVNWNLQTKYTDAASMIFADEIISAQTKSEDIFTIKKAFQKSGNYEIQLINNKIENKEPIRYRVEVIEDQFPELELTVVEDSVLYNFVMLSGKASDDYGIRDLTLHYSIKRKQEEKEKNKSIAIDIRANSQNERFFLNWEIDTLNLKSGEQINYYVEVRDNDAVNGYKSSRSGLYTLKMPDSKKIKEEIQEKQKRTEESSSSTQKNAEELKNRIEEISQKLKGQKELRFQDRKDVENLIQERQRLEKEIEKLQELNREQEAQRERFQEDNEKIKEKSEAFEQHLEDLMDEETRELYEELKKLMEDEKTRVEDVNEKLDKIKNRERNLERELERAIEMFKEMKFDRKLDDNIRELEDIKEEQKSLAKEEELNNDESIQKQEELNERFEELEKEMEELKKLNEDLKRPKKMEDTKGDQEQIKDKQEKSINELKEQKKQDAQKNQQDAGEKMEQMLEKMQGMQFDLELEALNENIDDLRMILDNLIKLSFDQEDLMKEFRNVRQTDPRFVELSQDQLKIQDNTKIVEDSLLALAERVFQLQSFITREMNDLNNHLDDTIYELRERNKAKATGKMQFSMTAMNNLALLLDDVLKNMQMSMAQSMGQPSMPDDSQQGEMEDLLNQQRQLNEQMQEIKDSGTEGRELSEELARMAAEQESIRRRLQDLMDKQGRSTEDEGNGNQQKLMESMEQTETDLVNKRLTEQLIRRQKEILTRMLEAEKSMREQEEDEERKGEQAKEYDRLRPKKFEEYIKAKEQQIEQLRSVPPALNPYYKREVNKYFDRLERKE